MAAPALGLMRNIAWSGAGGAGRVVFQLATAVILARLLTPEDFGLIAMVTVLTNFVAVFGELGLSAALIQRAELHEGHRSSTFWLTLALGSAVGVGVWFAAPWIALFYRNELLVPIACFVAPSFPLASFSVVQRAVMTRDMRFREIGLVEVCATLLGGAVGVGAALSGFGVWSLVAQLLATVSGEALGFWLVAGWRPQFRFDRVAVRELLPFSLNFLGFTLVNYWVRNLDSLLIGRFVGSAGLGIYDRAYRTLLVPLTHTSGVMARVMFPALSKIQGDRATVKALYLRALRSISLLTFPATVGLFVAAEAFVLTLFGAQWAEIVPVLRVLCVVGLLQSVSSSTGWLYQSQGKTDVLLRWGLFSGAVSVVAFAVGIQWGVMGVAVAYALRTVVLTPLAFLIPGRFVGIRLREVMAALGGTLACAFGMGAAVALVARALPSDVSHPASLAIQSSFGIACYVAIAHASGLAAYRDAREMLRNYRSPLRREEAIVGSS